VSILRHVTAFDAGERQAWAGKVSAYAASFAKLCAHPIPALLDAASVKPGLHLLDVGTGSGSVAAAAVERGLRVTAVDAQPDMVAWTARAVPAADVRVAELPHLPFDDGTFDATVANFVLNHVGRPAAALSELARVTRPGGTVAVTLWAVPAGAGAQLIPCAVEASGARRPDSWPVLPPEENFERTPSGVAELFRAAGLVKKVECQTLAWDHRTSPQEWWSGPASGVASAGQILASSPAEVVAAAKDHYIRLSSGFADPYGQLVLPHRALLAAARV